VILPPSDGPVAHASTASAAGGILHRFAWQSRPGSGLIGSFPFCRAVCGAAAGTETPPFPPGNIV
jgi:hypothetical protein